MSKNTTPNQAQKDWMKNIAKFIQDESLSVLYGDEFEGRTDFQLHHVLGRAAKHNKVAIGHWFILPVPVELHDPGSNHPDNVTRFKHNFTNRFGMQRDIFNSLTYHMELNGFNVSPDDVYSSIMDTRS